MARKFGEEAADLGPHFGSSGEAFPVGANQADELVALVDGRDVSTSAFVMPVRMADAIDQQSLDVGLQAGEHGIVLGNLVPCLERQQGFDCAGRTGIERDRFCLSRLERKKKAMLMGITGSPIGRRSFRSLARCWALRETRLYFDFSMPSKSSAGIAGAENLARREFDQVRMLVSQPGAAQLAELDRARRARRATRELAQNAEGLLKAEQWILQAWQILSSIVMPAQSAPSLRALTSIAGSCQRVPIRLSSATKPDRMALPVREFRARSHRAQIRRSPSSTMARTSFGGGAAAVAALVTRTRHHALVDADEFDACRRACAAGGACARPPFTRVSRSSGCRE